MNKIVSLFVQRAYGAYYNFLVAFAPKKTASKAFELFCTVRKGKIQPQQVSFLNGAKDRKIQVEEHTIQTYRWPGNKETVLLVHGWESNTFRWRNLIAKLTEAEFNVVAFDAPGHGYSSGKKLHAPLFEKIVDQVIMAYDPRYAVGHSFGGMTLMYNEHLRKNQGIEKLVTVASPSEFYEIMDHYQHLLKFNGKVYQALDAYVKNRFGFNIHEFSTSEFARTNTKKGLLFHDRLDRITPFHASERVHKNWRASRLVATEGLGHSMHQDAVNDAIISFLEN